MLKDALQARNKDRRRWNTPADLAANLLRHLQETGCHTTCQHYAYMERFKKK